MPTDQQGFRGLTSSGPPRAPALGRRSVLGTGLLGLLAACSGDGGTTNPSASATKASATRPAPLPTSDWSIRWATWPEYIDVDDAGKRPSLAAFTKATSISVRYDEVVEDNEEYVATIRDKLTAGQDVGADALTLTSWMCAALARAGWLQPYGPVSHADALIPALAAPDWDPDQTLSMPWQAGLTGIAYDARKVGRAIGSVNELFTRADLKGKVGLLTEFSDTMGMALLAQGRPVATASPADATAAVAFLAEQRASGQATKYYGNDYLDALGSGEIVASMAWSGDILQAQGENPYLKFVVPEEGLMIWADNIVVPTGSKQGAAVAALVDYYYQPAVAAQVAAWVNFICPVVGAQEELDKLDPDLASSPLIFPDASILDQSYQFPSFAADEDARLRTAFADLTKGG